MKKMITSLFLFNILFLGSPYMDASATLANLTVTSSSFASNGPIPSKFSYLGGNVSPQISWSNGPLGTKSYVILCQDPDAPRKEPWVHWIVYNIPTTSQSVAEKYATFPQGTTDYKKVGWGGPNPPTGPAHHYHFYVYALDSDLPDLKNPTKAQLMQAINKHKILAKGVLIGTYKAA